MTICEQGIDSFSGIGALTNDWNRGMQLQDRRAKVVYPGLVADLSDLDFRGFITAGGRILQESDGQISRVQARVLTTKGLALNQNSFAPFSLEAVVPIGNKPFIANGSELVFCYLGGITQDRAMQAGVRQQVDGLINSCRSQVLGNYWKTSHSLPDGYELEQLNSFVDQEDLNILAQLYKYCLPVYLESMTLEALTKKYQSSVTAFVVRQQQSREIIAAINCEFLAIPIGDEVISILELTDFATSLEKRKKGFSNFLRASAIQWAITNNLADAVIVEANGFSPGANKGNIPLGLDYCGVLPLSCRLKADSGSEIGQIRDSLPLEYQDFAPIVVWGNSVDNLRNFLP